MAIYRQNAEADIINGLITIGGEVAQSRDITDRTLHVPSGAAIAQFNEVDSRYLAGGWTEGRGMNQVTSANTVNGSGGYDATIYLPAHNNRQNVLFGLTYNYATTPGTGLIAVESPSGTRVFQQSVTTAGPNSLSFEHGLRGANGDDMCIRLTDGDADKAISLTGWRFE